MKRPLIGAICYALLVSFVTYSPTVACDSKEKTTDAIETSVCRAAETVAVHVEVLHEDADTRVPDRLSTVKSSLRAGVAVGKAVGRAAITLATSMARTARHVASAVLLTAYELA